MESKPIIYFLIKLWFLVNLLLTATNGKKAVNYQHPITTGLIVNTPIQVVNSANN